MNINEVTPTFLLNLIKIHTASVFIRQANRVGRLETLRNKYSQDKRLIFPNSNDKKKRSFFAVFL